MKKKFIALITSFALLTTVAASPLVGAINVTKGGGDTEQGVLTNKDGDDFKTLLGRIMSTLFFILGIAAVIFIILGGYNYATSNGDSGKTKKAKDTILYACIGLILAIMAYAIVGFVLSAFKI